MPHRARPQSGTRSKLSYCAALAQDARQDLDQAVHVGFLADERRQETQRMRTRSVDHGTGGQRAGNNIMRVARGIIQITAEHQAATTYLGHVRQLGELCLHIGTHLGSMVGIIAAHKRGERRGARPPPPSSYRQRSSRGRPA